MYAMRFIDSSFTRTCVTLIEYQSSNLAAYRRTGLLCLTFNLRRQKSSNVAVETRRLAGDVGGQLRSQLRIAIARQLLRVSGNRGERGAKFERHLRGNLAMQLLLMTDSFKFAAVADQTSGPDQAAVDSRYRRDRDLETDLPAVRSAVVGLELPALAAIAQ